MYSKTGCRTCKIRKVKCDEAHPACRRCVSTGRTCDGYGIWGKDKMTSARSQVIQIHRDGAVFPRSINAPVLPTTVLEKEYFDWFRSRTVFKLPGSFTSEFWSRLLLQASLRDPAILHASLALSAIHKTGATNDNDSTEQLERFALSHYVKAIDHLKPHFLAKSRISFQTIIIACVVFVSLEFLRGHFETALAHLRNGFKIIEEANLLPEEYDSTAVSAPQHSLTDDWIMEAFFRLHFQVGLFKRSYQGPVVAFQENEPTSNSRKFLSFKEAWESLDCQMKKSLHLSHLNRHREVANVYPPYHSTSVKEQEEILKRLKWWLAAYKASSHAIICHGAHDEEKAYLILAVYHTMATIMAEVCLYPDDEMVFDTQTHQFARLIKQMENLFNVGQASWDFANSVNYPFNMARSIVDMGCIAPLYYVAVKCRVHSLRLQAVKLLESVFHREGIWDARTTASVARKVMELEEGHFFHKAGPPDDLSLFGCRRLGDPSESILPEHQRIHDVEFVFSGNPAERILLLGRRHGSEDIRSCVAEYHMSSRTWVDM